MAALTDLAWEQVGNEINLDRPPLRMIEYSEDGNTYNRLFLDLSKVVGEEIGSAGSLGVVKFAAKFHDFCRKAQDTANANQPRGEQLNAFSLPTFGPVNAGYAPVTRTSVGRVNMGSATKIIEPNI